jgi:hypothetical protein
MRKALALFVLAVAACAVVACGGGGDPTGEEITERVEDAVQEDGMVYHAVGDNGTEIWLDPEDEMYRRVDETDAGLVTSVGEGWTEIAYDPLNNIVTEEDRNPTGPERPRIDNPMIIWLEPLSALAFAQEFNVIGKTSADGRLVLAVEAQTPITSDGQLTGRTLVGRVEVDPDSYLPLAYEQREDVPAGASPSFERERTVYTTSELIPRDDLPDDWFDRVAVDEQKISVQENINLMRDLGITPYWLGEDYESEYGILSLPPEQSVFTNSETGQGEMHYALIVPTSETEVEPLLDAVVVRLGLNADGFGPPTFPEIAGNLPEGLKEVDVRGGTGALFTSGLLPSDLGCGEVECPETTAKLYRRLVFSIGETVIQIEALAKINAGGADLDGYNSEEGLLALADALTEATPKEE